MNSDKRLGPSLVSLAVLALGAVVLWMTAHAPVSAAFAKIGPTAFPFGIGALLILMGGLLFRDAWRGQWFCEATDPAEPRPDLGPLMWVCAGLLANIVLIKVIGFILSSAIMYVLIAKAFGARRLWLAAIVGFLLALTAYYGFAQLLGLRMGDGLIEDLF